MATQLKASLHSGRGGNGKGKGRAIHLEHPDAAKQPKWDEARTELNLYWSCSDGGEIKLTPGKRDLYKSELDFYSDKFGRGLEEQNARHEKSRHRERIKTMEQFYNTKNCQPEEFIIQVGNLDQERSEGIYTDDFKERFAAASTDYLNWLTDNYGSKMQILSAALHLDEASPHIHVRRVWFSENKDGCDMPAQEDALKCLGFELPKPGEAVGRYNNRKISFDNQARQKLYDFYDRYGFNIDREAKYSLAKHLDTEEYVLNKLIEREKEVESLRAQLKELKGKFQEQKASYDKNKGIIERQVSKYHENKDAMEKQETKLNDLQERSERANFQLEQTRALVQMEQQTAERKKRQAEAYAVRQAEILDEMKRLDLTEHNPLTVKYLNLEAELNEVYENMNDLVELLHHNREKIAPELREEIDKLVYGHKGPVDPVLDATLGKKKKSRDHEDR